MSSLLKRPVERVLSSSVVAYANRHRVRGKRLILAYHGVIPDGAAAAGERALFVSQRKFAAHLDMLAEVADVAPLDQLDEEGDGRPRIAITLDDAYCGAVREAVTELVQRGLPATIFVAPARLEGHVFWWDALSSDLGILDPALRSYALNSLSGSDERVRDWASRAHLSSTDNVPVYARAATLDDLRRAVSMPGITVGSHTWSHQNLARLQLDEVISEVRRPHAWLKREFGEKFTGWLAYPYGLTCVAAEYAVADASYVGAVGITGGWHAPSKVSSFSRPRVNVPSGLSVLGLKARLLGGVPT